MGLVLVRAIFIFTLDNFQLDFLTKKNYLLNLYGNKFGTCRPMSSGSSNNTKYKVSPCYRDRDFSYWGYSEYKRQYICINYFHNKLYPVFSRYSEYQRNIKNELCYSIKFSDERVLNGS